MKRRDLDEFLFEDENGEEFIFEDALSGFQVDISPEGSNVNRDSYTNINENEAEKSQSLYDFMEEDDETSNEEEEFIFEDTTEKSKSIKVKIYKPKKKVAQTNNNEQFIYEEDGEDYYSNSEYENYPKKKSSKGKKILLTSIIVLIIGGIIGAGIYFLFFRGSSLLNVISPQIEAGSSEVEDALSLVSLKPGDEGKYSISVIADGGFDKGKVGLYTIVYGLTDENQDIKEVEVEIEVVDTIAPNITSKRVFVNQNAEFNISEFLIVEDNSTNPLEISTSAVVDTSVTGESTIFVLVKDASGNEVSEEVVVEVGYSDDDFFGFLTGGFWVLDNYESVGVTSHLEFVESGEELLVNTTFNGGYTTAKVMSIQKSPSDESRVFYLNIIQDTYGKVGYSYKFKIDLGPTGDGKISFAAYDSSNDNFLEYSEYVFLDQSQLDEALGF